MKKKTRWLLVAAVTLLAGFALVACGSDDSEQGSNGSGGASTAKAGPGNETDAMFVNGMIPHHEGAVAMAEIAQERAEHPEIKKLANDIILAQEQEIGTMAPIRKTLVKEHGDVQMEGKHGMGMSEEEIGKLKTADPFDREFIDMMVPHHQSAVTMAKEELAKGENKTLRKLAEDIIAAQNREIELMQSWRKEWYGSAGADAQRGDDSMDHNSSGGH